MDEIILRRIGCRGQCFQAIQPVPRILMAVKDHNQVVETSLNKAVAPCKHPHPTTKSSKWSQLIKLRLISTLRISTISAVAPPQTTPMVFQWLPSLLEPKKTLTR